MNSLTHHNEEHAGEDHEHRPHQEVHPAKQKQHPDAEGIAHAQ